MTGKPHAAAGKGLGREGKKTTTKKKLSNTDARPRSSSQAHSPSHFPCRRPLSNDYTSDRFTERILEPGTPLSLTRSLALPARLHAVLLKQDKPARNPPQEEVTSTGAPSFPALANRGCRLNWTSVGQYCAATEDPSDFIITQDIEVTVTG